MNGKRQAADDDDVNTSSLAQGVMASHAQINAAHFLSPSFIRMNLIMIQISRKSNLGAEQFSKSYAEV
jgi:hypothetical protein